MLQEGAKQLTACIYTAERKLHFMTRRGSTGTS
jgi:hypothetical protein